VVCGATKDWTCVVFALVWVTKVVVVVVAVDTVVLLVWPRVIVASEYFEFILPVRHQRGRHFAGHICLQYIYSDMLSSRMMLQQHAEMGMRKDGTRE